MRVLLLDDEPLELEQLEFLINKHFPTLIIEKAKNGKDALKIAEQTVQVNEAFQLALVDIKMPGKDGLTVAGELKQLMPDIDIIVISAFQEFEYAKKSMYLKAVDYLVKPIIEREFVQVLQKYIEEHPPSKYKSEAVRQTVTIIKNRYFEQLKLAQIADELYTNSSYLSRIFNEEVGMSFSDFLLEYRIKIAKQLLVKQKDWSMQQISEACGFNSQHYFSTSFKKLTQLTPKKYKDSM